MKCHDERLKRSKKSKEKEKEKENNVTLPQLIFDKSLPSLPAEAEKV